MDNVIWFKMKVRTSLLFVKSSFAYLDKDSEKRKLTSEKGQRKHRDYTGQKLRQFIQFGLFHNVKYTVLAMLSMIVFCNKQMTKNRHFTIFYMSAVYCYFHNAEER